MQILHTSLELLRKMDKFLKRDFYEKIMFGWVTGVRQNLPSISLDKSIDQFYKHFNLTEDVFIKKASAKRTYERMIVEFLETQKSNDKKTNPTEMGNITKES